MIKIKRSLRYTSIGFLILIIILVIARVLAPSLITDYANQQIKKTPGISGNIDDVDLALYRGAYKVKNLTLFLQENVDKPTIKIESVDFSILWSALFNGSIVTEIHVYNGDYEFIDIEQQEDNLNVDAKKKETWLPLIKLASPISIDKIGIHNNSMTLTTKTGEIIHKTFIDNLNGEIINLTNSRNFSGSNVSRFSLQGDFMSEAKASLTGSLDPNTEKPTFDINFEMQKLPVKHLDGFIDFYAPVDVEAGDIDAALEIVATNGEVDGYIKAGIYNAQVFTWKGDIVQDDDGLFTGIFEGLVDVVASIFENSERNLIAINVPVNGTIDNTEVSTFQALSSLFYNAFVDAYEIEVDNTFDLDEPVTPKKEPDSSNNE